MTDGISRIRVLAAFAVALLVPLVLEVFLLLLVSGQNYGSYGDFEEGYVSKNISTLFLVLMPLTLLVFIFCATIVFGIAKIYRRNSAKFLVETSVLVGFGLGLLSHAIPTIMMYIRTGTWIFSPFAALLLGLFFALLAGVCAWVFCMLARVSRG